MVSNTSRPVAVPTDKELDELVEYEMDEPDMVFITQTLPGLKIQIAEDKFEKIVDRLEKESYKLVIPSTPSLTSTFSQCHA